MYHAIDFYMYVDTLDGISSPLTAQCKSWTLDYGLDHGLDYGQTFWQASTQLIIGGFKPSTTHLWTHCGALI